MDRQLTGFYHWLTQLASVSMLWMLAAANLCLCVCHSNTSEPQSTRLRITSCGWMFCVLTFVNRTDSLVWVCRLSGVRTESIKSVCHTHTVTCRPQHHDATVTDTLHHHQHTLWGGGGGGGGTGPLEHVLISSLHLIWHILSFRSVNFMWAGCDNKNTFYTV